VIMFIVRQVTKLFLLQQMWNYPDVRFEAFTLKTGPAKSYESVVSYCNTAVSQPRRLWLECEIILPHFPNLKPQYPYNYCHTGTKTAMNLWTRNSNKETHENKNAVEFNSTMKWWNWKTIPLFYDPVQWFPKLCP